MCLPLYYIDFDELQIGSMAKFIFDKIYEGKIAQKNKHESIISIKFNLNTILLIVTLNRWYTINAICRIDATLYGPNMRANIFENSTEKTMNKFMFKNRMWSGKVFGYIEYIGKIMWLKVETFCIK